MEEVYIVVCEMWSKDGDEYAGMSIIDCYRSYAEADKIANERNLGRTSQQQNWNYYVETATLQ